MPIPFSFAHGVMEYRTNQNTTQVKPQVTLHISFLLVDSNFKIVLALNLERRQKNSYHIKSVFTIKVLLFWRRTFVFLLLGITYTKFKTKIIIP